MQTKLPCINCIQVAAKLSEAHKSTSHLPNRLCIVERAYFSGDVWVVPVGITVRAEEVKIPRYISKTMYVYTHGKNSWGTRYRTGRSKDMDQWGHAHVYTKKREFSCRVHACSQKPKLICEPTLYCHTLCCDTLYCRTLYCHTPDDWSTVLTDFQTLASEQIWNSSFGDWAQSVNSPLQNLVARKHEQYSKIRLQWVFNPSPLTQSTPRQGKGFLEKHGYLSPINTYVCFMN